MAKVESVKSQPTNGSIADEPQIPGITVRDYFIGQAIAGMMVGDMPLAKVGRIACDVADAVMKERAVRKWD